MEKNDALTLACEHIFDTHMYKPCVVCPAYINCDYNEQRKHNPNVCIKNIKQHFQQQSNIADGWDVVKRIYTFAKDYHNYQPDIIEYIEKEIQQLGIKA